MHISFGVLETLQIQVIFYHINSQSFQSACGMHLHHYKFFQLVLYHLQILLEDMAHQCFYSQLYTAQTKNI